MKSVYVGNLPYATTDNELKALFEPFGTVASARIKTDRDTGRPLGYGFVLMEDADAAKAIEALDGKEYAGRNLRVNESRERGASGDRPQRRPPTDRPKRDFSSDRGSDRPPRRNFGERSGESFAERPRRDFKGGKFASPAERPETEDFDDADDSSDYSAVSNDFSGNDRPQRRRTFRKVNPYNRDNRDGDRPRRPFFKSAPRKKGYRPNEDYESEE